MSAVVEFVSNVVEDVVDAVGDVVETVVDVVEDAVEFVGDTVQAIVEDPLPTLLSIAGSFVGIPPPVTMAAITAARGGDLEDIVLSAGVAYLAPQASNALSSTLSSTIGGGIINQTVSDIVVDGVSKGLVSGTIAEIRGGDFEDGFAGGFTGSIVNSSVGEFTNEFISPGVQDMLADSGLDTSTINTIVKTGTQAVSSGLTAELTGRGDFDDAFINSVQNSTINLGTNYAVNTIGDQFRSVEEGLSTVQKEEDKESDLLNFDDYFALDTTRDSDATGAGISDDIVDQVQVADTGNDTGNVTSTLANTDLSTSFDTELDTELSSYGTDTGKNIGSTPNVDTLMADTDAIINEFEGEDTDGDGATVTVEGLPSDLQDIYEQYAIDTTGDDKSADIADTTPKIDIAGITTDQDTSGGLNVVKKAVDTPSDLTEEDIVFSGGKATVDAEDTLVDDTLTATAKKTTPVDPYAGLDEGITNLTEDGTVDVAGGKTPSIIDGGLNVLSDIAGRTGLVDSGGGMSTDKMVTGALNQFLRPAIKTGLTRAIKGTPTKTIVKRPVQKKAPLTALQAQKVRGANQPQQAPRSIDMSKITGKPVAKVAPPKKVDVKTLTPITNVASLSSILSGGKG
jgi:hypothetical protein